MQFCNPTFESRLFVHGVPFKTQDLRFIWRSWNHLQIWSPSLEVSFIHNNLIQKTSATPATLKSPNFHFKIQAQLLLYTTVKELTNRCMICQHQATHLPCLQWIPRYQGVEQRSIWCNTWIFLICKLLLNIVNCLPLVKVFGGLQSRKYYSLGRYIKACSYRCMRVQL